MAEAIFPNEIENILAALSCAYKQNQQTTLLEIIVKGKYTINLFNTTDNWNGGTYTHTITFEIPRDLYAKIYRYITDIQETLCSDINKICRIENESIDRIDITMDTEATQDWRRESGLLTTPSISSDIQEGLWGKEGNYRVFISHKTECKKQASELKNRLSAIGVSCFVAHEDIEPTSNWVEEILAALFSADALLVLISEKFYESQWTDQEIGCAIGRNIPIFACRLGNDPHGFIGRFQAITSSWDDLHNKLVPYLLKESKMKKAVIQSTKTFDCYSFGKYLLNALEQIEYYAESEIDELVFNYNNSLYMQNCRALNQNQYLSFINRKSKRNFARDSNGIISESFNMLIQ